MKTLSCFLATWVTATALLLWLATRHDTQIDLGRANHVEPALARGAGILAQPVGGRSLQPAEHVHRAFLADANGIAEEGLTAVIPRRRLPAQQFRDINLQIRKR